LKDVSLTHRSTGYISTRRARNVKQQPSYNIDIQKSIVDMDPIHIHTYLCLKKAWKGMIIILVGSQNFVFKTIEQKESK
jgi:hypothetical protein